jgi:23S rRNA (pseudouridine1915-N3)-methyltransferase
VKGLLLLWFGKRGPDGVEQLADDYRGRIARFVPIAEQRLRPAAGQRADRAGTLEREAAELRRHLRAGDQLVTLDERGRQVSTVELSAFLGEATGRGRVVFAIGSDLGLAEGLRREARLELALSRLTLPHQLARLILLEQLYRALDLAAGGPYHRGDGGVGL